MHFEHLIEINDPAQPFLPVLSRIQLWHGLMRRVEEATLFLPGLDGCQILARGVDWVQRVLRFGALEIQDRVRFCSGDWVSFETLPSAHHGGGVLTIRIEEPVPGQLFLRFHYDTVYALGHEQEDAAYADYLREAYKAVDIETVEVIRRLSDTLALH